VDRGGGERTSHRRRARFPLGVGERIQKKRRVQTNLSLNPFEP